MHDHFIQYIYLILIILALVMIANKLRLPYPIVLDEMNHVAEFDEELIRKYLSLVDIEEFKIREKQLEEDSGESAA